jgi:hypothetical protein
MSTNYPRSVTLVHGNGVTEAAAGCEPDRGASRAFGRAGGGADGYSASGRGLERISLSSLLG